MAKFVKVTAAPNNEVLHINFDLVVMVLPRLSAGKETGSYVLVHGEKQKIEVRETASKILEDFRNA